MTRPKGSPQFRAEQVPTLGRHITEGCSLEELQESIGQSTVRPGTAAARFAEEVLNITIEEGEGDVSTN